MRLLCGQAPLWLKESFSEYGFVLEEVGICEKLPAAVAHHIDLMKVKIGDRLFETQELGDKYPFDVPLNVAQVGRYLICNPKTASPDILNYSKDIGLEIIPTAQGYTKCSILVLNETSIITEDDSIYNAAWDKLDVLKIEKGHVNLPGYDYGFIGGASCTVNDTVYFFGKISAHPDFDRIKNFITSKGLYMTELGHGETLLDIGGVIAI